MDRPPVIVELSHTAHASSDGAPRIAIVVERDPDLRETLTQYLLSQQHHVLGLSITPQQDELRRLQPDLLVIDLLCDGEPISLQTLHQFRTSLDRSIIVAMSANSHHDTDYMAGIDALVAAVLIKPFDLDHFDAVVGLRSS